MRPWSRSLPRHGRTTSGPPARVAYSATLMSSGPASMSPSRTTASSSSVGRHGFAGSTTYEWYTIPSNTDTPRMITSSRSGHVGRSLRSPVERARLALERTFDLRGDPPAVEPARLRRRLLVTDPALVDARRVERDVIAQHLELGLRR